MTKPPIHRDFTDAQLSRYARHIVLPELGGIGQSKLMDSSVLVIGAGGLGSPLLLYLAAAGVGLIGVIDDDVVDLSNLQRQVMHDTARVGDAKVDSARDAIAARARERGCDDGATEHTRYLRDPDGRRVAVSTYPLPGA